MAEIPTELTPRLTAFLACAKEHLAKREAHLSAQALEDRFAGEHRKRCSDPTFRIDAGSVSLRSDLDR